MRCTPYFTMFLTAALVIGVALYATVAQAEVVAKSVTGQNGVRVERSLVLKDPRDRTMSFCQIMKYDGGPLDPHPEHENVVCVHMHLQHVLQYLTPCLLVHVEARGPELVCGKENIEQFEKLGETLFLVPQSL